MRRRIRPLSYTTVLVMMIVAIFLSVKPLGQNALAQEKDEFAMYYLWVFCESSQVASATFAAAGTGMMGTKVICAGKCEGKTISFEEALAGLSAGVTAGLKAELQKHEVKAAAGKAKSIAHCGSKCADNANNYDEYVRKRQAAMELFKHASELRLTASKLLTEEWRSEADELSETADGEIRDDVIELVWNQHASRIKRKLAQAKTTLTRFAAGVIRTFPRAMKTSNIVGWIDTGAGLLQRVPAYADQYARYQQEAQDATKRAERLWREALAAFEESVKGKCADSREVLPDEDRARLERAKEAIEEWDNNQNLYWDPIQKEVVTFSEAIRRANEYLKSGQISNLPLKANLVMAAFAGSNGFADKKKLRAAITELDKAIPAWDRLNESVAKYLTNQKSIEQKLDAAFGVTSSQKSVPNAPNPKDKLELSGLLTSLYIAAPWHFLNFLPEPQ